MWLECITLTVERKGIHEIIAAASFTRNLNPAGYGLFGLAATLISRVEWIIPALYSTTVVKFVSETENWQLVSKTVLRLYLGASVSVAALVWVVGPALARAVSEPSLATSLRLFAVEVPIRESLHRTISACRRYFVRPPLFTRSAAACSFSRPLFFVAVCTRRLDVALTPTVFALSGSVAAQNAAAPMAGHLVSGARPCLWSHSLDTSCSSLDVSPSGRQWSP